MKYVQTVKNDDDGTCFFVALELDVRFFLLLPHVF